MTMKLFEAGDLEVTACASTCSVCRQVKPAVQFTSPHGYVVLCAADLDRLMFVLNTYAFLYSPRETTNAKP